MEPDDDDEDDEDEALDEAGYELDPLQSTCSCTLQKTSYEVNFTYILPFDTLTDVLHKKYSLNGKA